MLFLLNGPADLWTRAVNLTVETQGEGEGYGVCTHAEYVRVRLVGSGLGSSLGCGGFLSLSQTRLPSLWKGKENCREVRGEGSGSGSGRSAVEEASGSDIWTGRRAGLFLF